MPKIQIKVRRNLVLAAACGDEKAYSEVENAARRPFRDYICSILFVEGCTEPELIYTVLSNALQCLHDALMASESTHWTPQTDSEFVDEFTEWAKGIADDTAVEKLIGALRNEENWAWEVVRRRIEDKIRGRAPRDDEKDVIQEILLRLLRYLRRLQ